MEIHFTYNLEFSGDACMYVFCFFLKLFDCCREEIVKSKFNSMIGLTDRERVDEALYDDYEPAKAREVYSPSNVHPLLFFSFLVEPCGVYDILDFTCLLVLCDKFT